MDLKPRVQNDANTNKAKNTDIDNIFQPLHVMAVIICVAIIVALGYFMYEAGRKTGYDTGVKEGKKQAASKLPNDPLGIFDRGSSVAGVTETGVVAKFENDLLTLDTSRGEQIKVKIDNDTKIKKAGQPFEKSEIKKGMKLTAFTEEVDSNLRAKQIIIPKDKKN